jgi:hypothetical protein
MSSDPIAGVTPHERRMRELEAIRRVVAECEPHVSSGTVPTDEVARIFEQAGSQLPGNSKLHAQFSGLARRLRQDPSGVIVGSKLRGVIARLRRQADQIGRYLEARDAKLRERS